MPTDVKLELDILDGLLRNVGRLDDVEIKAGLQGSVDQELLIAAVTNEFGSDDGRIPERSWMRSTFAAKNDEWAELAALLAADAMDGGSFQLSTWANRLGEHMVGDLALAMTDLRDPPNAPSTIKRKGSDNPLIDTGRTRLAITYTHTA